MYKERERHIDAWSMEWHFIEPNGRIHFIHRDQHQNKKTTHPHDLHCRVSQKTLRGQTHLILYGYYFAKHCAALRSAWASNQWPIGVTQKVIENTRHVIIIL